MTNKEIFIETVSDLFDKQADKIPDAAWMYLDELRNTTEKEKPMFTENGAKVLKWMQENYESYNNIFKAKEIAEGLFLPSSRTASGAIRKLITDKYVSKTTGTPVCYSLTDAGKMVEVIMPEKHDDEES